VHSIAASGPGAYENTHREDIPTMPDLHRLGLATLNDLPAAVQRPQYDPRSTGQGIVHLGIGAFHRAHQAVYVDDCLSADPRWGILGASLRNGETAQALNPQDGLYSIAISGTQGVHRRVIGAVRSVLLYGGDARPLLTAMAGEDTRIVSLTVTEKGYAHVPATGDLNEADAAIQADLANPRNPRSAIGLVSEALRLRRSAGLKPFTVLCCDNLPSNGPTVRRIVLHYAALVDADLARWIADEARFPATMVDRIVPATTDEDRSAAASALGLVDAWPVATEPFSQWVIEDFFTLDRPAFETAGAQMTRDVAPFEHMKLRMLNGSHSTLAYLGFLAGHETVADAIADAPFNALVHGLMTEEVMPVLAMPDGVDVAGYRDALLARFANPGLRHRTWQIAMDGTQKLPQRLLGTIRERLKRGQPINRLALGVAGWMRYVMGKDEAGQPIDIRDPQAAVLAGIAATHGHDVDSYASALFRLESVFGQDLPNDPEFTGPVTGHLRRLLTEGARRAVSNL
jgi:fructuronate reductase